MASELGWDESRIQDEIADLEKIYIVIPEDKKPRQLSAVGE
jgi:hypothetical protein